MNIRNAFDATARFLKRAGQLPIKVNPDDAETGTSTSYEILEAGNFQPSGRGSKPLDVPPRRV